jgi:hypothetical protein
MNDATDAALVRAPAVDPSNCDRPALPAHLIGLAEMARAYARAAAINR